MSMHGKMRNFLVVGVLLFLASEYNGVETKVLNRAKAPIVNALEIQEDDDVVERKQNDRNAVANDKRWIKGIVPYVIDPSLPESIKPLVAEAIADYHKMTCLKFREKTSADKDWVVILNTDVGCNSYVGRYGGPQPLNLKSSCAKDKGAVIHELMHAIGFNHEQGRPDRDDYIVIITENVKPDKLKDFKKYDGQTLGLPYDYGSIMHYGEFYNSIDYGKLPTLKRKDGQPLKTQSLGLSPLDVAKINKYYECST